MSNDKTLATVKHGGCVQFGGGLPPLPPEVDAVRCMIRGEEDMAEACDYYYTADQMRDYASAALSERIGQDGILTDAARAAIPFVAYAFSEGVTGAEEAGRAIEAALSAQPSPGGQGDALTILDRVEFALRDAGFNYDEAFRIANLAARQPVGQEPFAGALEETRVRDLREYFDVAHQALANPAARIPSDEWGGRKDMMCPDDEDEGLDFNRSGWSAEVMAFGPLGVRPEDSIVLTASAAAAIQQVLMELLQAATSAQPAQAVDLGQFRPAVRCLINESWAKADIEEAKRLLALIDSQAVK